MDRTIPVMLADAASRDADATWLRTSTTALTFGEATARVATAAARLRDFGVGPGDRVVIVMRNAPSYLLAWLAVTSIGAIAVLANPSYTATEHDGLVQQTTPRLTIGQDNISEYVNDVTSYSEPLRTSVGPDDLAVLLPTSGTTGRSKLVMQTHRAYAMAGEGFPHWMELRSSDVLMTSLPLFHVNALAYSTMGSMHIGAHLVVLPKFSASGFLDSARRFGATEFNAIGAMLEILMRQPQLADDADNPLRLCYVGPSPTEGRHKEIEQRFGLRVVCGYALSESPYGTIWPHGTRPYGTLGALRQHPRLGHVNDGKVVADDGRELGAGETGEFCLKNPTVTPGYWGMPEETAKVIVDGWLHTGDLVTSGADGTYTYVGRTKDVLRRRGENLSPLEVEEAISSHPAVTECAVIGVPSELTEDDIKAFVVPAAGHKVDYAEVRVWAAERLAAFKVPRYWQAVDALPRTPTERIAKHQLSRERNTEEYDAEAAPPEGST